MVLEIMLGLYTAYLITFFIRVISDKVLVIEILQHAILFASVLAYIVALFIDNTIETLLSSLFLIQLLIIHLYPYTSSP